MRLVEIAKGQWINPDHVVKVADIVGGGSTIRMVNGNMYEVFGQNSAEVAMRIMTEDARPVKLPY